VKTELIVALDFPNAQAALNLARQLNGVVCHCKVGKELFVAEGPAVVRALRERGMNVFLDLKFHDIPNTVARACESAAKLNVHLLTIHASGGSEMMRAASEAMRTAAKSTSDRPKMLGVTVLTSMDDASLKEIGVDHTAAGQVLHLARLAQASGLDGVVASVNEAQMIRDECGADFLIVTPGIRPASDSAQDQKRTATPRQAVEAGANYIVVGRPITANPDPEKAARRILDELAASN
jgi:orotidine-5'-phosphate decarboxylase